MPDDSTRDVDDQAAAHEASPEGDGLDPEEYEFDDADRDKVVLSAEGEQVGTIERVIDGDPEVRADPEMPGELRDALGIEEGSGDAAVTSRLQHEHIDTVGEDAVHLRH